MTEARHAGAVARTPLRILIVEDDPNDAQLAVHALRWSGFDPAWERVESEAQFVARLEPDLDLILSDYSLPGFTGLDALRRARAAGIGVPFIMISGSVSEAVTARALREGADDFLSKESLDRLGEAVRRVLEKRGPDR